LDKASGRFFPAKADAEVPRVILAIHASRKKQNALFRHDFVAKGISRSGRSRGESDGSGLWPSPLEAIVVSGEKTIEEERDWLR